MRQPRPERVGGQAAFELAAHCQRDRARLLGDDNRNRVVLFGEAERRAVAGAEIAAHAWIDRQRQKTGRGRDAIALDDDRAVVQRRRWLEDARQQVVGDHRVERNAALDVVAKADLPLEHDDGARCGARPGSSAATTSSSIVSSACSARSK